MTITPELLKQIAPGNKKPKLLTDLAHFMERDLIIYGIDLPQEQRHFIAQLAHESDSFNTLEEYASGKAYEGRKDLGNIYAGDGVKFKGRGPIQVTGRANYYAMGVKRGDPQMFIRKPELLATPEYGLWAAVQFWNDRHLSDYAIMPDTARIQTKKYGALSPIEYITYRINGGQNGLADRKKFYERAKKFIV
jgi:putative chitinase